ncbi:Iron-sensing transcription factor 1 [Smittium culicis]|uniref:Iron-sensing transcription factor 1 n=1 Tax=Smittium culicis TaxID=133412 RepID=A0A1R1XSI9_9FUNG|nr:Iron-sensing transcription factor 1 [Smittium culicis]
MNYKLSISESKSTSTTLDNNIAIKCEFINSTPRIELEEENLKRDAEMVSPEIKDVQSSIKINQDKKVSLPRISNLDFYKTAITSRKSRNLNTFFSEDNKEFKYRESYEIFNKRRFSIQETARPINSNGSTPSPLFRKRKSSFENIEDNGTKIKKAILEYSENPEFKKDGLLKRYYESNFMANGGSKMSHNKNSPFQGAVTKSQLPKTLNESYKNTTSSGKLNWVSFESSKNACTNCNVTSTPLWRRDNNGFRLCNACGLYLRNYGKHRSPKKKISQTPTFEANSLNREKSNNPFKARSERFLFLRYNNECRGNEAGNKGLSDLSPSFHDDTANRESGYSCDNESRFRSSPEIPNRKQSVHGFLDDSYTDIKTSDKQKADRNSIHFKNLYASLIKKNNFHASNENKTKAKNEHGQNQRVYNSCTTKPSFIDHERINSINSNNTRHKLYTVENPLSHDINNGNTINKSFLSENNEFKFIKTKFRNVFATSKHDMLKRDNSLSPSQPKKIKCHNCCATTTPLWRRDRSGNSICNACGLYYKLHKATRPVSLNRKL